MPAAVRTDFADRRDRHDSIWMQAVLIGRIYGPSAIEMVIWVLSVVLALGASSVMYYYIAARGKIPLHAYLGKGSFTKLTLAQL